MTNLDELEDLLRKGEKEKAYKLIKEDNGITTDILINGGIIFGTIEEDGLSISYFEFAEKISEDNEIKEEARGKLAVAYNNRGNAYSTLKQHEKAIGDFSKAIELNPKEAGFYFNRGSTYLKLNRYKKAIEDFDRAIKLNPSSTEAYLNRDAAYQYLSQYEKAIKDFTKVIERNPRLVSQQLSF